ncbi:hypothetical protein JYP46_00725 [Nitratireductor aquimarinus]|uniref:hypothetical protein n=1 Tax=Alphaproteobacteria TaxID=28211 RepID=UPI0019D38AF4|nr:MULTISPECIES: hypothetical protein [Alphaproteobacteria]MBN7755334.1 hypothetical protein [Nitratireductor aquimarinus]MBY5998089.1 hypothetical protein [Tritonibacter mobilis]MBY6020116.1 hypothetical protein [Nitratireductor sp. DP7N14-4]
MSTLSDTENKGATHARGPWPFITLRSFVLHGQHIVLKSRERRKGLIRFLQHDDAPAWRQPAYNWWMGLIFACGASLFMLGAALSLVHTSLANWQIGLVFFLGSIPFTTAAFMQNLQAANAPDDAPPKASAAPQPFRVIGWRPGNLGWLSTITQFVGTIAFNFNTLDAIHPLPGWYAQDLTIWLPGIVGSILFMISGYLAFMEISHGYWSYSSRDIDWWIAFSNLLGCIFFLTAGVLAFVPRGPEPGWIADVANIHLFLGATGFLVGAVLMMRESRQVETIDNARKTASQATA